MAFNKEIFEIEKNTVLAKFEEQPKKFQTNLDNEAEVEKNLIKHLETLGYEYVEIKNKEQLIANLRKQLERLNNYQFSDEGWKSFLEKHFSREKINFEECMEIVQKDNYLKEHSDNKNIKFFDKYNLNENKVQVINQYHHEWDDSLRSDVTILVNGFPLVQIELKKQGTKIEEAFSQIAYYNKKAFSNPGSLFNFIQIFVISNGIETKYFSNNKIANNDYKSFQFTINWTDEKNNYINHIEDFTNEFLKKRNLLNIIFKYCVYNVQKKLLVMRPYQIVAVEKIIDKVEHAINSKTYGRKEAGGYIWHTTGSGKTLTSFKTAQLISNLFKDSDQKTKIAKIFFIVDRKDLDSQTIQEYNKFEENCVYENKSSKQLLKQIKDDKTNLIVTTIQKMSNLINDNDLKIFDEPVVMLFDECHRTQFGEMHKKIIQKFKKYIIFGFTGTPIFDENAPGPIILNNTTEKIFGDKIHVYNIIDAFNDKKVLGFLYERGRGIKIKENIENKLVSGIDKNTYYHKHERIESIVKYILDNFQNIVRYNDDYGHNKTIKFNSLFAVDSIASAKQYYIEFKKQNKDREKNIKIATIFSYSSSWKNSNDNLLEDGENIEDSSKLSIEDKEFLQEAICEYNKNFNTEFSTNTFNDYYRDISFRMKNCEIDLLIVVGMFLTGFDSKCLSTLFIDRELKYHNIIQAISRTNRIYNDQKIAGKIIPFRANEKNIDDALALYCDKKKSSIIFVRSFDEYYSGYTDDEGKRHKSYKEILNSLEKSYQITKDKENWETNWQDYLKKLNRYFGRYRILTIFEEFNDEKKIVDETRIQQYIALKNDLKSTFQKPDKKANIANMVEDDDEFVQRFYIGIQYIFDLIIKRKSTSNLDEIKKYDDRILVYIEANPKLRPIKKHLIDFSKKENCNQDNAFSSFNDYLSNIIKTKIDNLVEKYNLDPELTHKLFKVVKETGMIDKIQIRELSKNNISFFDYDYNQKKNS